MTLTRQFAEFIEWLSHDNIPGDVVEKAKACLLNGYGIGLGSHDTPYAPVARRAVLAIDGERAAGATLLGDGRKTTVAGAAMANAALFHGRAQEDTCGSVHIGTVVIPLLTALLEAGRVPGSRFLPSLVAGYEVGGILENELTFKTTAGGFRATALYGTIAAAAAAGKAIGLDREQLQSALANAASFTGGILQSFVEGTDEWRFQVGVAGRLGLIAAELARAGSISARHAIEGKAGFIRSFARTESGMSTAVKNRLGSEWSVRRVSFKPYPVCAINQTPVHSALILREKVGARTIARVRIRMNPLEAGYAGVACKGPFSSISGTLMSAPFCVATTLLRGAPTMRVMTIYNDDDVNEMVNRMEVVPDDSIGRWSCVIEAVLEDGTSVADKLEMTELDYSYDRAGVSALVRRIGSEMGVPGQAYTFLEEFVESLPNADVDLVLRSFSLAPKGPVPRDR